MCVEYKVNEEEIDYFPSDLERVEPVYEMLRGWRTDISNATRFDELPVEAIKYVNFIQNYLGVPIKRVGVGPDREQIIKV